MHMRFLTLGHKLKEVQHLAHLVDMSHRWKNELFVSLYIFQQPTPSVAATDLWTTFAVLAAATSITM